MSDDNKELDDFIDEEEYKKAIAALESSKSIRLKENQIKKKQEAEAKKVAQKKERQELTQKKIEQSGIKNPFLAKCITDPIIPICILVAALAVIGLALYILIPKFSTPAMSFTLDEFRGKYASTDIYRNSLGQFGFEIPSVTYVESNVNTNQSSIALTADPNALNPVKEVDSKYLVYFSSSVANSATSFGTAIQGSCRKSDHKLTALRVMAEYSASDDYYNFLLVYFGSYLQAFYPELTSDQALDLAQVAIGDFKNTTFTVNGDYAYRVVMQTSGEVTYFALDVVTASSVTK